MPLSLKPPREKRTPFWYIRGTLYGRTIYASTKSRNSKDAQRFKERFELELAKADKQRRSPTTFHAAAKAYADYRQVSRIERQRIDRVAAMLGDYQLSDIHQHILVTAANEIYPRGEAATKNRNVLTVAGSILHYAAKSNLCPYIRVHKFKEKSPEPRALSKEQARVLISNAEGEMKLLLIWLFYQGWRISDALRLQWSDIDISCAQVRYHISKTDEWRIMPLHTNVIEAMRSSCGRVGKVFHWGSRAALYRDLRPFCKRLRIAFTPHMARHSFATWLANEGVSPLEIMEAGGWRDLKSVSRYAKLDPNRLRTIINKLV